MKAYTREEQYLKAMSGEEQTIPDKPLTRMELYLAKLCGEDTPIPDKPLTREELYLAKLCGEGVSTPDKPLTRIEMYMSVAAGLSDVKPEPLNRREYFWNMYAEGGTRVFLKVNNDRLKANDGRLLLTV